MFDRLPHTFHNLKCLKLVLRNDTYINLVANLLKRSPHLETLILEVVKDVTIKNWGDELSFESKFHHLKSIEIKDISDCLNLKNCGNLFKLLEFLLKNAVVLENVILTDNEELSSGDLEELNKKLQAIPRASSSVTILFP
ncbi:hypothetical protein AQUCO_03500264v1 [Aquilegia coerulea]|uniref:FBD domain-containing protein n=1 Tax=Aquilegia coerulea TaxID=218851 RepID=A0A2G5CWX5_AQUCA|nr:hypothetical protein AQUCO_03500264v1 [Aquilegia coerulea]